MATAILNKANKGISHFAKEFATPGHFGGGNTISALKKIIIITTDKKSVQHSEQILKDLLEFIETLPTQDKDVKGGSLKKNLDKTNNNIQFVNSILNDINKLIGDDNNIVVDDKNMKSFISNFKKIKDSLEYVSNYLSLTLEVHEVKKEYKNGKGNNYTIDELLELLKAA